MGRGLFCKPPRRTEARRAYSSTTAGVYAHFNRMCVFVLSYYIGIELKRREYTDKRSIKYEFV